MINKYLKLSNEKLDSHLSNFLVSSWSYSGVGSFTRNPKQFEMTYIYGMPSNFTANTKAGNAYHEALKFFFMNFKEHEKIELATLTTIAVNYINELPANDWKMTTTCPTVDANVQAATKTAIRLIENFFEDINVYLDEIEEVLGVEEKYTSWIVLNGVDIPLPCHAYVDLRIKTKDGKTVIIDHKSKRSFTTEKELAFTGAKQAITYIKCAEEKYHEKIDEVWYIENKYSKNKDGSPQLKKYPIIIDDNMRKLYESILYESLRSMLLAVQDPDFIFTINDNDSFSDIPALYEFWCKTMIADLNEFNIDEGKRDLISRRQKKIKDASIGSITPKIITEFRENAKKFISYNFNNENMTEEEKVEGILRTFGMIVNVAHRIDGYSSITLLLDVRSGTKIGSVMKYKLDIANALNVSSIRVSQQLVVYEGTSYLSIEAPKKRTEDLIWDEKYLLKKGRLPIGISNYGDVVYWDLNNSATPHLLMCGSTGSGKTVSIISTIAYAKLSGITDIYVFDTKYSLGIKDPSIHVFNEILDIENEMIKLVEEMQSMAKHGNNNNIKLLIFDELADALDSARKGKALDIIKDVKVGEYKMKKGDFFAQPKMKPTKVGEINSLAQNLKMLLQKGRSLGFRILTSTQRASTKVIEGDAKVNYPINVCYRVPNEVSSRVVIDEPGAESLAGKGDGLMKSPEFDGAVRFQAFYKEG